MTKHHNLRVLSLLLLVVLFIASLCGCGRFSKRTVIYPCYFNRDVDGLDANAICEILEQAGWEKGVRYSEVNIDCLVTTFRLDDQEGIKVISIEEYPSCQEAEQSFAEQWGVIAGGLFAHHEDEYHITHLRISNCTIMTMRNAHADLMEMLELETVEALEVPLENTYEMCQDADSVDFEAVKTAMEADGYQFYASEFFADDEQDGTFSSTYIFFSPEQDRIYAYTMGEKPSVWGMPYAYWTYQTVERLLEKSGIKDMNVGIHFVGFKDGGCVLCYGNSFEEIREYFAN